MKKIALLLAILLALGACFMACGDKKEDNKEDGIQQYVVFEGDYQSVDGTSLVSSNSAVVEVMRDGLLLACSAGTATVTGKNGDKDVSYTITVVGLDNVTLGSDYKKIDEKKFKETFDADIAELISQYLEYTEVTDRTDVREGDKVNIKYVGKINGKEFEGGTGTYDLVIGSDSFIDGFEDGLIGKENGTTVDLNLTFPDPYTNNPDLAGKPVVFTVTINKISAPEPYSDEFIKKVTGYDTIAEYEEHQKMLVATDMMFTQLSSGSKITDIPEEVKDYYFDGYVQDMIEYLSSYGMSVTSKQEINSVMGYTEANFDSMVWESVNTKINQDYVFYRYCKERGLKLTDELYQKHLSEFLKLYDCADEAALLKTYKITLDTLYETFLYELVMEDLYQNVEFVSGTK